MAYSQSTSSICSDLSSIFSMEKDGRCIILKEKWQDIKALFEKWEPNYKRYDVFTQEEIEASDDNFEAVTDIDTERGQICLAIIDFALYATNHFDIEGDEDRQKMTGVARNCVRKKAQMEAMPTGKIRTW